ncbi:MAG: hypothetical protein ABJA35_11705 [Parafilimonas sp.]
MGIYIEDNFEIHVNTEVYKVESVTGSNNSFKFRISTACEYMFTLNLDDEGNWKMEDDVIPMNDELVNQIGQAIEQHNL